MVARRFADVEGPGQGPPRQALSDLLDPKLRYHHLFASRWNEIGHQKVQAYGISVGREVNVVSQFDQTDVAVFSLLVLKPLLRQPTIFTNVHIQGEEFF